MGNLFFIADVAKDVSYFLLLPSLGPSLKFKHKNSKIQVTHSIKQQGPPYHFKQTTLNFFLLIFFFIFCNFIYFSIRLILFPKVTLNSPSFFSIKGTFFLSKYSINFWSIYILNLTYSHCSN